ncbi:MAG: hypothetical protein NVV73_10400 [Cellvibrionaceae bacterium]|nr:hypothetical protein [Cellvibrionaceae bacterium]
MKLKRTRFSFPHFVGFLESVWEEKLVRKNILKRWQEAIEEFQQVMTDEEVADLRCVDVKCLGARYVDLLVERRRSITPWRIYHLKNAFAQSIGDFVAFTINPNEYRRSASFAMAKQVFLQNQAETQASSVVVLPTYHGSARVSVAR